ncbi:NADP-reducing hydrogenase subunit HndB [bioreactor metagenome]|jgi:NADP-reducing hydrogenase subunit HndB|uniref:NADP-reducing hydrogenase subunit HndB n=1 Tax=bioreactor metagenome TaxID=1076179 RepID=A0A644W1A6_9ZZZZ|nr:(2Fe-2S) ferredoxin domain-containing protein [Aminivibrio sp.]MDD3514480.1 (2Fe-2S) ferredoxin domain-containing protein [Synergistaceae bacterium]MEA4953815.1 (2Fe-2S) ferredoxin domain-containing protein [Aminivibrio sp.]NCB15970.1 (2Fe-2S) ferredoxin domain-containing protein [Synergistales bacterium]HPF84931.1 (2Fe-2S) ferredoxin domain-containing protein [Aminivibrio sp.]
MTQMKIRNLDDLRKLRESSRDLSSARSGGETVIIVGMGTCGIAAGARDILSEVMAELARRSIDNVAVQTTGCIGMCQDEPLLDVIRGGQRVTYGRVKPEDVPTIIAEHVVNGRVVEKMAIGRAD